MEDQPAAVKRAWVYAAFAVVMLEAASPSAVVRSAGDTATPAHALVVPVLRPGDIIFRRGVGPASVAVLASEDRPEFSHVGIVVVHGGTAWVVHAVPAETAGERDATKMEPLATFLQPSRASRVAVYRLDRTRFDDPKASAARAAEAAEDMARRAVPFDFDFDLSTSDALYCTELVLRAYALAGIDLGVRGSKLPFIHHAVVLPSNLLRSPVLDKVP